MKRLAFTVLILCSALSSLLLASKFDGGYQSEYLGALNQAGYTVHLWKVIPSHSESERLVKMAVRENEIAGFWIE